jgi:hypothetical protein
MFGAGVAVTDAAGSALGYCELLHESRRKTVEEVAAVVPQDRDGNPTSMGSLKHAYGKCRICEDFKAGHCRKGVRCGFCHFDHSQCPPTAPTPAVSGWKTTRQGAALRQPEAAAATTVTVPPQTTLVAIAVPMLIPATCTAPPAPQHFVQGGPPQPQMPLPTLLGRTSLHGAADDYKKCRYTGHPEGDRRNVVRVDVDTWPDTPTPFNGSNATFNDTPTPTSPCDGSVSYPSSPSYPSGTSTPPVEVSMSLGVHHLSVKNTFIHFKAEEHDGASRRRCKSCPPAELPSLRDDGVVHAKSSQF